MCREKLTELINNIGLNLKIPASKNTDIVVLYNHTNLINLRLLSGIVDTDTFDLSNGWIVNDLNKAGQLNASNILSEKIEYDNGIYRYT